MTSDESDDEPLSVIAANKREQAAEESAEITLVPVKKKKKVSPPKRLSITIKLQRKKTDQPPVIERPADVWLYLKDFNPAGPYSCLLCSDWFINRSKIIIHYVLNHKKDFCGICRYFVPDRDSWWKHQKFHTPWPCSQCVQNFETEVEIRHHLKTVHNLVHCRLCHFRVLDGDPYHTHLFQKHNISNVANKDEESLWELEYDGTSNFQCLLCNKTNITTRTFFNHYMGYHHFTLKCFTHLISGRDPPFTVYGADLRPEFVEEQLKNHPRYGYVESDFKPAGCPIDTDPNATKDLLKVLIPEIKQEVVTVDETKTDDGLEKPKDDDYDDVYKNYNGDDDFDVTSLELVAVQKCYHDYISEILSEVNAKSFFEYSDVNYDKITTEITMDIVCTLCSVRYSTLSLFSAHMFKMHCIKSSPIFSCRVCVTPFENQTELDNHITNELGDFEDLWICQFCDKEFDDRESTRRHLTEHWDLVEYDNCFSPHLGFKCRYCPTLFWHETDRETHQVRAHYFNHKEDYYKCETCNELYSDKIWFVHHYIERHCTPEKTPLYLLKCYLCCLVLPTIEEMRGHFNCEHPEARKVFCSLNSCQYKPLSHRKSFKLHVRSMHTSRARPERAADCSVCGREFSSSRACGAHMAQAHGPGKFKKLHYLISHPGQHPFECNECGKSFQYKSSLYMHKQDHMPNKQNYTCTYCGKTFLVNLETCPVCSKLFTSACSLREHMKIHEPKKELIKCPLCDRKYQDERYMLRHLRTSHTRARHPCPICNKMLTSPAGLRHHVITHSNMKTIQCKMCPKAYSVKRTMIKHFRRRHGFKGTEPNIKEFYTRLDPRECNLGLDEPLMTSIFGPPKKKMDDLLMSNYVTLTNQNQLPERVPMQAPESETAEDTPNEHSQQSNDNDNDEQSQESERESSFAQPDKVVIKVEAKDDEDFEHDPELEPTDFVSVKIEPVDDDQ
ncbi:hypothetical protein HF086_002573 [Spodoptera exigua]|uniref:C2H2-type domain-containing protein n=1 Tax=Spodoptera exigua TaxID=7107 RepID=A0A922MVB7_SPOEX|nr:hypothetical protein HF086_002573 [Spodoptera exigua]